MKKRSIFLRVILLFAIILAVGASPAVAQEDAGFTLTILHTNDTHARIEQFAGSGSTCSEEQAANGACVGGVARRATMITLAPASASSRATWQPIPTDPPVIIDT